MSVQLCPTCGGTPGRREWLTVAMPHEDKPIEVAMCDDDLHVQADAHAADVARLKAVIDAQKAVVEAAVAYETWSDDAASNALINAVRAMKEQTR